MGYLRLPENLRQELTKEYGILLAGSPDENAVRAIELLESKRPPKVIVVGDFTLMSLINHGFVPDLAVYDRKTKRSDLLDIDLSPSFIVKNPPGKITDEAFSAIKVALESKARTAIYVEGEEDLLSIPAILLSPVGSFVVYGMPDRGMVIVEANEETKNKVRLILERFERVD